MRKKNTVTAMHTHRHLHTYIEKEKESVCSMQFTKHQQPLFCQFLFHSFPFIFSLFSIRSNLSPSSFFHFDYFFPFNFIFFPLYNGPSTSVQCCFTSYKLAYSPLSFSKNIINEQPQQQKQKEKWFKERKKSNFVLTDMNDSLIERVSEWASIDI